MIKLYKLALMFFGVLLTSIGHATIIVWDETVVQDPWSGPNYFSNGYSEDFDPFYADELVAITGNGYFDRLSIDGLEQGDLTFTMQLRLDGVWTTVWSFLSLGDEFAQAGEEERGFFITLSDEGGLEPSKTSPEEYGIQGFSNLLFDHALVSGIRFSVDQSYRWAFHHVVGDVFTFADSTDVPTPPTLALSLAGMLALALRRRRLSAKRN